MFFNDFLESGFDVHVLARQSRGFQTCATKRSMKFIDSTDYTQSMFRARHIMTYFLMQIKQ